MVYKNKKGFVNLMLLFFVFFVFIVLVIAGTAFYGLDTFEEVASGVTGLTIGNVSYEETYQQTLGQGLQTVISIVSATSFAMILGMIIVMLIIGFKTEDKNKYWAILDLFIIVVAFIAAVYISGTFDSYINSNQIFLDIYSIELQRPAAFLLNLPLIVTIVGAIVVLVTYIPLKRRGEPNVLQFN